MTGKARGGWPLEDATPQLAADTRADMIDAALNYRRRNDADITPALLQSLYGFAAGRVAEVGEQAIAEARRRCIDAEGHDDG